MRQTEFGNVADILIFTADELELVERTMKVRKADPNGIRSEVLKAVFCQKPKLLLKMYNAWLTSARKKSDHRFL